MAERIQYSVVLTKGPDAGLERWVWYNKNRFNSFDRFDSKRVFGVDGNEIRVLNGTLSVIAQNEEVANALTSQFGIPDPFLDYFDGYTLNRYGE